ncbi:hypothetical protein BZG01_16330 [Labilibaculum manganireducens]|uniref:Uncharacterized protein n=1 Tax=Labilibaculum manganireducens TaxID=1940525 RepID=A0A2N3HZ28_9BACT|nr:hypothetical protein [Labilibaculum manganireducens]PKQ63287.1 hypothetical protein BZG01_16330 [Labilibaculum manganireducens]
MFNWIVFRIFEYFSKKDDSIAISNTINFMVLLQASMLVPLFLILNLFVKIDAKVFGDNDNAKYLIGVPLAIVLLVVNSFFYKKKLQGDYLKKLEVLFYKEKYKISVWIIFLAPVFFAFVCPIIYGILNGTLSFPFLER